MISSPNHEKHRFTHSFAHYFIRSRYRRALPSCSNDPSDVEAIRDALHAITAPPGKQFHPSSDGIAGALEAIRNGKDID